MMDTLELDLSNSHRIAPRKSDAGAYNNAYFLLALLSCFLFPFASIFFIILYIRSEKHSSVGLAILVGLCSGAIAYGVNTTLMADIDRYTNSLPIFRETSFWDLLSIKGVYSSVGSHGYNLFAWIVSRFNDDHLLRSAVTATFYSVLAFIVDDYAALQGWSFRRTCAALLISVAIPPFFNVLSYAKSTPAFSLLLLALYLDFGKRTGPVVLILLYAFAASTHSSVLPVIALRVVLLFVKNEIAIYGISLALLPLSNMLSAALPASFRTIPVLSLFTSALDKFSVYSEFSDWGWAAASQHSVLLMGYRYYFEAIAVFCILLVFRRYDVSKSGLLVFSGIWSALCIAVSVFFAADVFFRYAMPCSTLFVLASLSHKDDAVNLFIDIALAIIAVIGFVVQWAYLASVADMSCFILHGLFGV